MKEKNPITIAIELSRSKKSIDTDHEDQEVEEEENPSKKVAKELIKKILSK